MITSILCAMVVLAAETPAPKYVLEISPAQRIDAVLTYEIATPKLEPDEWVAYVAKPPQAPSVPGQSETTVKCAPAAKAAVDKSALNRPLMLIRDSGRKQPSKRSVAFRVEYAATLMSRKLRAVKQGEEVPPVESLTPQQRTAALGKGVQYNFDDKAFQAWLDEKDSRRVAEETDIDFARRVFSLIKRTFTYDYAAEMDRRASAVCAAGKSDCGGLSILMCSILRANDIPARALVGRWALSSEQGQALSGVPYYQQHVKAEFFADGVGWVPFDMASAVVHDAKGDGSRYFGKDRGDFLTMHVDPDLVIDTIHFGRKDVTVLQGVIFWVTGTGTLDGMTTKENWQVKRVTDAK